jgi:hypothetical protein
MRSVLLAVLKFIVFILLIPVIISSTTGFKNEIMQLDQVTLRFFISGIISFLIVYLFIAEPQGLYDYGQRLVSHIFSFFQPLVEIAPFVIPIYSIIFLIVYSVSSLIFVMEKYQNIFIFLFSFSFVMHLVMTAKVLKNKGGESGGADYCFATGLIYLLNIFFISLFLDLVVTGFSFPEFFKTAAHIAGKIYVTVFRQFFV